MVIKNISIHKIDIKENNIINIPYSSENIDFASYVSGIISDVLKGEKSRRFKFVSDTTEMFTLINQSVYDNKFIDSVKRSSEKLFAEEIRAQAIIARLGTEIQKGILIQTHINHNNLEKFIICKADDSPYIDEISFKLANGYPLKRKIFKSCLLTLSSNKNISEIQVYDTTSASYWYCDYLELEALLDDTENTIKAFETIDNVIFSPMKKDSLNDHWELRNSLITKMKSESSFDIYQYADDFLAKYTPTNSKLNMQSIASKVKSLPQKFNFDNTFNLVPKAITAKTKKLIVPLTESIDLTIKDSIDTSDTIVPFLGNDDTKYVAIKSNIGYDTFKKNN